MSIFPPNYLLFVYMSYILSRVTPIRAKTVSPSYQPFLKPSRNPSSKQTNGCSELTFTDSQSHELGEVVTFAITKLYNITARGYYVNQSTISTPTPMYSKLSGSRFESGLGINSYEQKSYEHEIDSNHFIQLDFTTLKYSPNAPYGVQIMIGSVQCSTATAGIGEGFEILGSNKAGIMGTSLLNSTCPYTFHNVYFPTPSYRNYNYFSVRAKLLNDVSKADVLISGLLVNCNKEPTMQPTSFPSTHPPTTEPSHVLTAPAPTPSTVSTEVSTYPTTESANAIILPANASKLQLQQTCSTPNGLGFDNLTCPYKHLTPLIIQAVTPEDEIHLAYFIVRQNITLNITQDCSSLVFQKSIYCTLASSLYAIDCDILNVTFIEARADTSSDVEFKYKVDYTYITSPAAVQNLSKASKVMLKLSSAESITSPLEHYFYQITAAINSSFINGQFTTLLNYYTNLHKTVYLPSMSTNMPIFEGPYSISASKQPSQQDPPHPIATNSLSASGIVLPQSVTIAVIVSAVSMVVVVALVIVYKNLVRRRKISEKALQKWSESQAGEVEITNNRAHLYDPANIGNTSLNLANRKSLLISDRSYSIPDYYYEESLWDVYKYRSEPHSGSWNEMQSTTTMKSRIVLNCNDSSQNKDRFTSGNV